MSAQIPHFHNQEPALSPQRPSSTWRQLLMIWLKAPISKDSSFAWLGNWSKAQRCHQQFASGFDGRCPMGSIIRWLRLFQTKDWNPRLWNGCECSPKSISTTGFWALSRWISQVFLRFWTLRSDHRINLPFLVGAPMVGGFIGWVSLDSEWFVDGQWWSIQINNCWS